MSEKALVVNGYDIYNDDMIVYNYNVERREMPLIWGSGPALYLNAPAFDSVMRIPSYGFLLGTRESLSLEFWVRFDNIDAHEFTDNIIVSSQQIIQFSANSSLRLFRNQLILTYFDDHIVAPFDRFGFPLLININYARKGSVLYVSILVDGVIVASKKLDYIKQDLQTKYILFTNDSSYKIIYGPIVMYPYNVTPDMATKHFIYGQGTAVPSAYKVMAGNTLTEQGGRFTKRQLQSVTIPDLLSWSSGTINNLANSSNALSFIPRTNPTPIINKDGEERYYFDKLQDYYSSKKYGLGLSAFIKDGIPNSKYVLATMRLGANFIVIYVKNHNVSIDYKINNIKVCDGSVSTIPITSTIDDFGYFDVDVSVIFDRLYEVVGSRGRALIENGSTKLTIGYIDEDINGEKVEIDGALVDDYYENIRRPEQNVNRVKFLTAESTISSANNILVEGDFGFGAVTWNDPDKHVYQFGSWEIEFPISLLTKSIDYIDESGLDFPQEQLDYIQYNINNYIDTESFIMIKDVTRTGGPVQIIDDQLIFDTTSSLFGKYVKISDNQILKLPYITQDQYKNLTVSLKVIVSSNKFNPVTQKISLTEIKLTGSTQPRTIPLITGNVTEQNVVPFERTDNMIFPKWNTDVILVTPTLDMPFYYLSNRLAYYLVDDQKFETSIWDRGFLISKDFNDDGSDKIFGFSTFIYVEENELTTHKFMRLNYVDFTAPNKLGHLEIQWTANNKFKIVSLPVGPYDPDIYIDYEKSASTSEYLTGRWYILTAIYTNYFIQWDNAQTKSIYLEFLSPKVYFSNPNILSINDFNENHFILDYHVASEQIVGYLNSSLTGAFSEIFVSTEPNTLVPIMQNAWTSAYINVLWDNISIQATDNI